MLLTKLKALLIVLSISLPVQAQQSVVVIDRSEGIVIGSTWCTLLEGEDDSFKLPSSLALCHPDTLVMEELTRHLPVFGRPTTSITLEDSNNRLEYPTCNLLERDGGIYLYDCMYARPAVPLE